MNNQEHLGTLAVEAAKCLTEKTKRIADLEECLAGFMVCGQMNGMYLTEEMQEWCKKQLVGKKRTPVQIWREITGL